MSRVQALLWDVDGTLAETERDGHRVAFNRAFEALGIPWRWDEAHYGRLLRITGGRERILHDMRNRSDAPPPAERDRIAAALHAKKNAFYAEMMARAAIPLRPGVQGLLEQAQGAGVRLGIVTTTSRSNVDALLRAHFGADWLRQFAVVVCGEDVARKKPDPEVYVKALAALQIDPLQAVAVEDSPGGVAAARAAGVPVIVTRSYYFPNDTVEDAIAIGPGFHTRRGWLPALPEPQRDGPVTLQDVTYWAERMELVSQFE
ncbi:MAG: HAD-IA family hydrolase [Burkholderiaceae bacterium]|nr:HAD-IA family hydrolase [Burkholderiaceae bacterium]